MAVASKNGELVAIQGKQFRDWIEKDPAGGTPLVMGVLQSTISRLRQTSHELSLVYGAGRLLAQDKPIAERVRETTEFLRTSLEDVDEITVYQRNPYWDEYEPFLTVPEGSSQAFPKEHPLVQQVAAVMRSIVPETKDATTALVPLLDPNDAEHPLQGFLYAVSRTNPRAFSPNILYLLEVVSVQISEVLLRHRQQEDHEAQSRLRKSKQSFNL